MYVRLRNVIALQLMLGGLSVHHNDHQTKIHQYCIGLVVMDDPSSERDGTNIIHNANDPNNGSRSLPEPIYSWWLERITFQILASSLNYISAPIGRFGSTRFFRNNDLIASFTSSDITTYMDSFVFQTQCSSSDRG